MLFQQNALHEIEGFFSGGSIEAVAIRLRCLAGAFPCYETIVIVEIAKSRDYNGYSLVTC